MNQSVVYADDVLNGEYLVYHPNGKLSIKYLVTDGKIEGKRMEYYPDGVLASEMNFKEGDRDGEYVYYYSNGKIKEKGQFKEGTKIGVNTSYFSSGVKSTEVLLDESGKENGTNTWFDVDGKKYLEFNFSKGDLKTLTYFDKKAFQRK